MYCSDLLSVVQRRIFECHASDSFDAGTSDNLDSAGFFICGIYTDRLVPDYLDALHNSWKCLVLQAGVLAFGVFSDQHDVNVLQKAKISNVGLMLVRADPRTCFKEILTLCLVGIVGMVTQ